MKLKIAIISFAAIVTSLFAGEVVMDLYFNTYAGEGAFVETANAENNTVYGNKSMTHGNRANDNIVIGSESHNYVLSNYHNIALGNGSMSFTTNNENCIAIGTGALANTMGMTNAVAIGNLIYSDGKKRFELSPRDNLNEGAKPLIWDDGVTKIGGEFVYIYPTMYATLSEYSELGTATYKPTLADGESMFRTVVGDVYYNSTSLKISKIVTKDIARLLPFTVSKYPTHGDVIDNTVWLENAYSERGEQIFYCIPHISGSNVYDEWYTYYFKIDNSASPISLVVRYDTSISYNYGTNANAHNKALETIKYPSTGNGFLYGEKVSATFDVPNSTAQDKLGMRSAATTKFVEEWTPNIRYEDGQLNVYDSNGNKIGKLNFTAD